MNRRLVRRPAVAALMLCIAGSWLLFTAGSCSREAARRSERMEGTLDWCVPHEVPESECTRCNPELIPAFKAKGDWCVEHGIPESQCVLCDPGRRRTPPAEVTAQGSPTGEGEAVASRRADPRDVGESPSNGRGADGLEAAGSGILSEDGFCSEHGVPEAVCAVCLPSLAAVLEVPELPRPTHRGPLIRLATADAARKAGLRAVRAARPPDRERVAVLAQVAFDGDRFARVACPAGGTIESIAVDLGDHVQAGQPLAILRSAEIAEARARAQSAQAHLRLAESEHARGLALHERGLLPERELLEGERELEVARAEDEGARRRLHALGVGEELGSAAHASDRLALTSPITGTVVGRTAMAGQVVDGEEVLLEVADTRSYWVNLDVPEATSNRVRMGQAIEIELDAYPGMRFAGTIVAVGGALHPENRMLRARARVADPEGMLKANLFGTGTIATGSARAQATVPREALQIVESVPVVFVRHEDDLFEVRAIHAGPPQEGRVPVLAGLEPNEEVVTDGSFLLKTHISKGSIGEGCCDVVETLGRRR